jgi:tetratricopeptide (TPR) repeat protein
MTEPSPRAPGRSKETGTDLSKAPEGYPARFTADAPDLASMEPQSPEEFTRRGWIYYQLDDYEKAESDFRQALAGDPANPNILYPLGLVLNTMNRPEEALDVFKQAMAEIEKVDNMGKAFMLRHLIQTHIDHLQPGSSHLE